MKKIEAKIIADSISPQGSRITSYLLTYPRFIHSELMTHRVFSRNSASSRAIPFEKMLKMVEEDPFIPVVWQKSHVGMQGSEYLTDIMDIERAEHRWRMSIANNIEQAKVLNDGIGVTKQLCNRLLEPFMWHTVMVTATEWDNFFELRCPKYKAPENSIETKGKIFRSKRDMIQFYIDDDFKIGVGALSLWNTTDWLKINESQAEIHIQALAEAMWDAKNESIPKTLQSGEWHIPFGDSIDGEKFKKYLFFNARTKGVPDEIVKKSIDNIKTKIATARCARLSYMTFDGEIDYEKDIALHDQLLKNHHMSPFEHCARAMSDYEYETFIKGIIHLDENGTMAETSPNCFGWCNNFRGFIQYRYLVENIKI